MGKIKAWKADFIYLENKYISNKLLICESGNIIDLIEEQDLEKKYRNAELLDLSGRILMPGFIDGHTHNELYSLYKDSHYNSLYELMENAGNWHKTEQDVMKNCFSAQLEKMKCGVLFQADWRSSPIHVQDYKYPDRILPFLEIINPVDERHNEKYLRNIKMLETEKWRYGIAPHSYYMVCGKMLEKNFRFSGVISTHLAECQDETVWIKENKGRLIEHCNRRSSIAKKTKQTYKSYAEFLNEEHFIKEGTIFVHCVQLQKSDFEFLKKHNCYVCLCTVSNLQLLNETVNFEWLIESNVSFIFGSDGFIHNDFLVTGRILLNAVQERKYAVADRIIYSLTTGAANALQLKQYGCLKKGNRADFLIMSLKNQCRDMNTKQLSYNLIMNGTIENVVINGSIIEFGGKHYERNYC